MTDETTDLRQPGVSLRTLPYPYRAMLAICSDLDETPSAAAYFEIAKYLNTRTATSMGSGLGLEVGNTIYFNMPSSEFAYWNTNDEGREMVRALIHSGHVDCLHSFGDLALTRADAARSLEEMDRHGCRLRVWIDHSTAVTNLGGDIMRGEGDLPGAVAYHADLTHAYGIRYVWRGRVTSVIGQDSPRRLGGVFDARHPWFSARTVAKEYVKGCFGRRASHKYAPHHTNSVMWRATLRSGQGVREFLRANPSWLGVGKHATGSAIGRILTERMLRTLVDRGGKMVLYTHLGKTGNDRGGLPAGARAGLERLAGFADRDILVTTTQRLLGYCTALHGVSVSQRNDPRGPVICVETTASDPLIGLTRADLDGLTVYVPSGRAVRLEVDGKEEPQLCHNPPDETGRPSVSLPWRRLRFPI